MPEPIDRGAPFKYGTQHQLHPEDADMLQRFHAAMMRRLYQLRSGASADIGNPVDVAIIMAQDWAKEKT